MLMSSDEHGKFALPYANEPSYANPGDFSITDLEDAAGGRGGDKDKGPRAEEPEADGEDPGEGKIEHSTQGLGGLSTARGGGEDSAQDVGAGRTEHNNRKREYSAQHLGRRVDSAQHPPPTGSAPQALVPGLIGAAVAAIAGAVSSFIAYQKKKLCFREHATRALIIAQAGPSIRNADVAHAGPAALPPLPHRRLEAKPRPGDALMA
ncbi:hypothetical protein LEMLEM_LOCUS18102 [Lemmus lemmus]